MNAFYSLAHRAMRPAFALHLWRPVMQTKLVRFISVPVSYTHLDVYKRQISASAMMPAMPEKLFMRVTTTA